MALQLETIDTPIISKTKELCQTIVDQPQVAELLKKVETFLQDAQAQSLYEKVTQKQQILVDRQNQGNPLADAEIDDFEQSRDELLSNPIANGFLEARQQIQQVQDSVASYVSKTFELGRVPEESELQSGGGCCGGGGGGGGCGCHG